MGTFNYTTKSRKILADLYTPVGIYMTLRDLYPQSMLMESSDYHGTDNSRSFIGIHPIAHIAVSHGEVKSVYPDGSTESKKIDSSVKGNAKEVVAAALNEFLSKFKVEAARLRILRCVWLYFV